MENTEERFSEALIWAGEMMESRGARAAMNFREGRGASNAVQAVRSPEFQARVA